MAAGQNEINSRGELSMSIHIGASEGQVAETVLLPGIRFGPSTLPRRT